MVENGSPRVVLVRHGATDWTVAGRHTGVTDLALTEEGQEQARAVGRRLGAFRFGAVLSSPRIRALDTCRLAGLAGQVCVVDDLAEWDYGDFEGQTTAEIHHEAPGWSLWDDGAPGGETPLDVTERADRVIGQLRRRTDESGGDVAVFSHGHFLRALAARWTGLDLAAGRALVLAPAALSILGYERETPAIRLWNEEIRL